MKINREPILKYVNPELLKEYDSSEIKKQTVSVIRPMVRGIARGKWKYVFTLNFNRLIDIITKDFDLWETGKEIERKIYPHLGENPKHLLCLKFETTKHGQLHVHGLLGGKISIDEINFESILKSLTFEVESVVSKFSLLVRSVHFEKFDQDPEKDWISYMFKNPDSNQRGNTLYYISRRVFKLIQKNNEYIQKIEAREIPMDELGSLKIFRFGKMLSEKFHQDFLVHMLSQPQQKELE